MGHPIFLVRFFSKNGQVGMGMPEYEIEQQLEKYWGCFERQLSDEDKQNLDRLLQDIEEHFVDPTEEHPVKAVEFVRWLDPTSILDVLRDTYPYFYWINERFMSRFRFFAYYALSKKRNLRQAYLSLSASGFLQLEERALLLELR